MFRKFLRGAAQVGFAALVPQVPGDLHGEKDNVNPNAPMTQARLDKLYERLVKGNRIWVESTNFRDPEFFAKQMAGQNPNTMWIGCSDSRVPANVITGSLPGEIFVHRNIANTVVHTDLNLLSVLQYAVDVLRVKHIIVCGHIGCGGVRASMELETKNFGLVENWLRHIQDVYELHASELDRIADPVERANKLTEYHVLEGVNNICKTSTLQRVWRERAEAGEPQWPQVHGWVYSINDGVVNELVHVRGPGDVRVPQPIHKSLF